MSGRAPYCGQWTDEGLWLLATDGPALLPADVIRRLRQEFGHVISIRAALDAHARTIRDNPGRIRPRRYLERNAREWIETAAADFPELYQTDKHRERLAAIAGEHRRRARDAEHQERIDRANRQAIVDAARDLVRDFDAHRRTEVVVEGYRDRHGHQVAVTVADLDSIVEQHPDLDRDAIVASALERAEYFNGLPAEDRPTRFEGFVQVAADRVRLARGDDFHRVVDGWHHSTAFIRSIGRPWPLPPQPWRRAGEHLDDAPGVPDDLRLAETVLADPDNQAARDAMADRLVKLGRLESTGPRGQLVCPLPFAHPTEVPEPEQEDATCNERS